MVTAGHDEGSCRFEQALLAEQLRFAVAGLRAAELPRVQVALTPLSEAGERASTGLAGLIDDQEFAADAVQAGTASQNPVAGRPGTLGIRNGDLCPFRPCPRPGHANGMNARFRRPSARQDDTAVRPAGAGSRPARPSRPTAPAAVRPGRSCASSCRRPRPGHGKRICCYAVTTTASPAAPWPQPTPSCARSPGHPAIPQPGSNSASTTRSSGPRRSTGGADSDPCGWRGSRRVVPPAAGSPSQTLEVTSPGPSAGRDGDLYLCPARASVGPACSQGRGRQ